MNDLNLSLIISFYKSLRCKNVPGHMITDLKYIKEFHSHLKVLNCVKSFLHDALKLPTEFKPNFVFKNSNFRSF